MNQLHRILELAESLSDQRVNFNVEVTHFLSGGQRVQLTIHQWFLSGGVPHSLASTYRMCSLDDYSTEDIGQCLELINHYGFRVPVDFEGQAA